MDGIGNWPPSRRARWVVGPLRGINAAANPDPTVLFRWRIYTLRCASAWNLVADALALAHRLEKGIVLLAPGVRLPPVVGVLIHFPGRERLIQTFRWQERCVLLRTLAPVGGIALQRRQFVAGEGAQPGEPLARQLGAPRAGQRCHQRLPGDILLRLTLTQNFERH